MKLALDPCMMRNTPLMELPGVDAELGYEYIELCGARTSHDSSSRRSSWGRGLFGIDQEEDDR